MPEQQVLTAFRFWSELSNEERFQVEYRGKRWTGYNSLVAGLRRALDERVPITTPRFWRHHRFTEDALRHVFRSATAETIPLLEQRFGILREAGEVLREVRVKYDTDTLSVHANLVELWR